MADHADRDRRHRLLLVLLVTLTGYSVLLLAARSSADLMAPWLAGHFYAAGALDQIYPPDTDLFTMLPPSDWAPYLATTDYQGAVFPFIYPPLWVVIMSWISGIAPPEGMRWVASLINPALLFGMVILVTRLTDLTEDKKRTATIIGALVLFFSVGGSVALVQNQPQILVSFLIVLAIERDRANRPFAAGTALAFAAALKLYPILFVLMWMAAGRWNSVKWAVLIGGALGITSILLAGWPLHAAFLQQTLLISRTAMMTPMNYGLDALIGYLSFADTATQIEQLSVGLGDEGYIGWSIVAKPLLWRMASIVLLLSAVTWPAWQIARKGDNRFLWPLSIAGIAFFSPLSWSYYYLPVIAFTPLLFEKLPPRTTILCLLPLVVIYFVTLLDSIGSHGTDALIHKAFLLLMSTPFFGILTMLWLSALFVFAARKA
ncbi:MAG: DUF2029 domain-containing protein [Marivivens sp.]|nr:DUF2029 domain-containing protein [Marivivens sp.]